MHLLIRAALKTPSSTRTGTKKTCVRTMDLYDTQLDTTRERRTHRYLAAMSVTHVLCIGPLMVLK